VAPRASVIITSMFTLEARDLVRDHVVDLAKRDHGSLLAPWLDRSPEMVEIAGRTST
jgi:hypothetical protein